MLPTLTPFNVVTHLAGPELGGLEADVIAEAHLDPDSIFAGVQPFAQERPKRLGRQRALLDALG